MGSTFLTYDEAANRLNCTKRSVHNYIEKGFLRRVRRDGKVYLEKDEVEQLAVDLGSDLPALTRRNMYDLASRLRKVEEKMAVMEQIWSTWGVQEKPLRPNTQDAGGLYNACTDFLQSDKWPLPMIENWAGIFNQVDEGFLEIVADAARTPKPWEVFHQLATKMLDYVTRAKDTNKSLMLQALQAKLGQGRKKIREAALFWMESGKGTVPVQLFRTFDNPQEDVLKAIIRRNGK